MNKQRGAVTALIMVVLLVAVVGIGYFGWSEYEQKLALTEDVERLESRLKSRQKEIRQKKAELNEGNSDNFRLNQQLLTLNTDIEKAQQALKESEAARAQVQNDLDKRDKEIAETKSAFDGKAKALNAKVNELGQSNANLEQQLSKIKEVAEGEKTALQKEKDALQAEQQRLTKTNADLGQQIDELNKALEQSMASHKEAETYLENMQQQVALERETLTNENVLLEEKNTVLTNEKVKLISERENLSKSNSQLEKQITQLNKALEESRVLQKKLESQNLKQPVSNSEETFKTEEKRPEPEKNV